jgi:alpha-ribazole phosphatase
MIKVNPNPLQQVIMQVHLIRHTTPDIATGICYGQTDIAVAKSFETEKNLIIKQLDSKYDAVFSSPLSRCTLLAQQIPTQDYQTDTGLLEMNFGTWELQNWNEIPQLNIWTNDFVNTKVEGGESFIEMYQRVVAFIEELVANSYEKVAIVTHAGVIRIFWAWILEIPLQNVFRLRVGYGDIYRLNLHLQKDYCSVGTL